MPDLVFYMLEVGYNLVQTLVNHRASSHIVTLKPEPPHLTNPCLSSNYNHWEVTGIALIALLQCTIIMKLRLWAFTCMSHGTQLIRLSLKNCCFWLFFFFFLALSDKWGMTCLKPLSIRHNSGENCQSIWSHWFHKSYCHSPTSCVLYIFLGQEYFWLIQNGPFCGLRFPLSTKLCIGVCDLCTGMYLFCTFYLFLVWIL